MTIFTIGDNNLKYHPHRQDYMRKNCLQKWWSVLSIHQPSFLHSHSLANRKLVVEILLPGLPVTKNKLAEILLCHSFDWKSFLVGENSVWNTFQPSSGPSENLRGRKDFLSAVYYPSLWSINSAFGLINFSLIAMLEATSYRYEVMQPKARTLQNTGAQQVRIKVRFHTLYLAIICSGVGLQCSKQV